jgi:hypothetical protein
MNDLIPFNDVQRMAMAMAKSGLFGMKTPEQAIALMLIAQAEGRHPASAARDYHIINGQPTKKADAMLRDFINAGGRVEWHELSELGAKATFSHPSVSAVTIVWGPAEAVKAGIAGKDMYKKYPRAMFRSRCVAEGVRSTYPAATGGLYEPNEMLDITPSAEPIDTTEQLAQFAAEVTAPSLQDEAREAAGQGRDAFGRFWVGCSQLQRNELRPIMEELQHLAEVADTDPEAVGR